MKRKRSRFDRLMLPTMAVGAVLAGVAASDAHAVLLYSVAGNTISEDFNTLTATAWTNDTTLPGWSLFRQPAPGTAITAIAVNNGSSNTGSFYSYGTTSAADRALGGLGSGGTYFGSPATGAVAGWIAVAIENDTGATISEVNVSYDGEQWRNGGNATAQTMIMEYGTGASFTTVSTWTAAGSAFDFTSPTATATAATLDGNAAANRIAAIGGTINSLTWNDGDTLWFRWQETNDAGNDHGLAIDNFSFSSAPITPPPPPANDVLPSVGQSITFDFTNFTGTGFAPIPTAGQLDSDNFIVTGFTDGSLAYGGTGTTGDFARGLSNGGVGTGGVYAFNVGAGGVALGVQPAGSDFNPGTIELRLENTTGSVIDLLSVDFEVLVLNNEPRSNTFAFSYSTDGISFIPVPQALVTSGLAADQLGWTVNPFSLTLASLGLADGEFLFLRWTGVDSTGSGNRDEFALDNIVITNRVAVAVIPEPVTFSMLIIGGVALMSRRQRMA